MTERKERRAQELRAKEKAIQEKEKEKALLLAFHATPEEKKAEFAKTYGIVHMVSAKYDTARRLKNVEEREKVAAAASEHSRKFLRPRRKSLLIPKRPRLPRRKLRQP